VTSNLLSEGLSGYQRIKDSTWDFSSFTPNTNAINIFEFYSLSPHLIPLPTRERGRVRGAGLFCKLNLAHPTGYITM
jgi:hypothetical protein